FQPGQELAINFFNISYLRRLPSMHVAFQLNNFAVRSALDWAQNHPDWRIELLRSSGPAD
ncbi:hypothetical protein C7B79_35050, partial [Chroococcidiopsis cubana CCALA 043]|uniref:hypothetical protein n=1 Tax=Chroococcidiopsis cubana TaxID=171392 RepID=UPI000D488644